MYGGNTVDIYVPFVNNKKKERISTTIRQDLAKQLRAKDIHFSYALNIGARHLLGEKTVLDESNEKLSLKIDKMSRLINDQARKIYDLEAKK